MSSAAEIAARVDHGHQQRADAFGVGTVRGRRRPSTSARRAVDAAFARGKEQRRQPAGRPVDGARLGRHLPLPVVHRRARVDVGAARDQLPDHRRLPLRDGPHQRRLAAPLLHRVDVGAVRAAARAPLRRCPVRATTISAVWPSAFGDSTSAPALSSASRSAGVAGDRRLGHRRRAVVVLRVDVGARLSRRWTSVEIVRRAPPSAAPSCRPPPAR